MTSTGSTSTVRPTVLRDFPTVIVYVQVAIFGWYVYSFGPSIALLRDEQGTTRTVASLHSTAAAIGAIVAGLIVAAVVRRIGRGPMLRSASVVLAAGLIIYISSTALPLTLLGAFVASLGGTSLLSGANAFIPDHQGPATPQAMSEAHGFASLTGLLGPLAVGAGVWVGWGWRPAIIAACVAVLILEIVRGRNLELYDGTHGHPDSQPGHAPHGPMPRRYWFTFFTIFAIIGTEFSLTLWGTDLLRDRASLGDAAAAASIATIVGGMALGRLVGSRLVAHIDPERVLIATLGLTLVGFAIAWFSGAAVPMLIGFAVTGTGMGLQVPLSIGRSVRASRGRVDRAAALASVALGAASGTAPFLLGAVADHLGVHTAFMVVPVLIVAAMVLVWIDPVPLVVDDDSA